MLHEHTTKIVFQGDSITDAGRPRDNDLSFGTGYPAFVAGRLGAEAPGRYSFVNRGVSGDRVASLYARWEWDTLCLKPDVLSILIGINDVWHNIDHGLRVDPKRFFRTLCTLLDETKEHLPDCRLILLEPFVLQGSATEPHWDAFLSDTKKVAQKVQDAAEKYGCDFIALQKDMETLSASLGAQECLLDGVHPAPAGHALIAQKWIDTLN